MDKNKNTYRFLFAGGGTGGHIFPAIAVAENIKLLKPEAEFLFVGTKSKIEAIVVPKLGFKFKAIWIKGFARKFSLQNLLFPLKLIVSSIQSLLISLKFKPDVAVGSGGYVSGPAVWSASVMGAKIILLEQNSFPGITTRLLEKKASEIHISYEDSKKYLKRKDRLFVSGNPVRASLSLIDKNEALQRFNFISTKKTLLILGGSLGAASINKAVADHLNEIVNKGIQIIWQTGKNYISLYQDSKSDSVWLNSFIEDMSAAFSACDLCISRAGATTIAELTNLGVPVIFVPSPNVAANHQYYNAKSLADKDAALIISDDKIDKELTKTIFNIIYDENKLNSLSVNIKKFGKPEAAKIIAKRALELAGAI